jgi:hypothetical protein
MGKQELDNLVQIGKLKAEAASRKEFYGMLASARRGLVDAQNESTETDSQFDLAYGAAHRFALAALRHQGYRSQDRITGWPPSGEGENGIVYDSVRRAGGTNVCVYRPSLIILPVNQVDHYEYRWDASGAISILKARERRVGRPAPVDR